MLPDLVKLFGGRPEHVLIDRGPGEKPVAIHGLSFAQPSAPESLLPKYRPAIPDTTNIGMMHTSLGGAEGHDVYAPCSPADLLATGFDYWALGHIHKRSVIEKGGAVVMPGMPQGRDINEDGPKSVTLVSIADDGAVSLEERPTSLAEFAPRWHQRRGHDRVERSGGRRQPGARRGSPKIRDAPSLWSASPSPAPRRSPGACAATPTCLMTEAEERAAQTGATWIEKLENGCTPPGTEGASSTRPPA